MKLEDCTLFVGCTSAFSDIDVDDTKINNKNDSTYDDSYDWKGKCQYEKYSESEYFSNTVQSSTKSYQSQRGLTII